jgi:hypothetical protein
MSPGPTRIAPRFGGDGAQRQRGPEYRRHQPPLLLVEPGILRLGRMQSEIAIRLSICSPELLSINKIMRASNPGETPRDSVPSPRLGEGAAVLRLLGGGGVVSPPAKLLSNWKTSCQRHVLLPCYFENFNILRNNAGSVPVRWVNFT